MEIGYATRILEGKDVTGAVDATVYTADIADDTDVERFKERMRGLKPSSSVVVAGNDNDVHRRTGSVEASESAIKERLRFARRVLAVENVSRDEEGIDLALIDNFD
jgi:hypothetical protein